MADVGSVLLVTKRRRRYSSRADGSPSWAWVGLLDGWVSSSRMSPVSSMVYPSPSRLRRRAPTSSSFTRDTNVSKTRSALDTWSGSAQPMLVS